MLIKWSKLAEDELIDALSWYVEQEDSVLAQRIATRLFAAIDRLSTFPNSGRQGLIPGTRELVIPDLPYFVVYRVTEHVEIVRVMHASRLWTENHT